MPETPKSSQSGDDAKLQALFQRLERKEEKSDEARLLTELRAAMHDGYAPMAEKVKLIDGRQRTAIVDKIEQDLEEPVTLEEHHEWQKEANILHAVDATRYQALRPSPLARLQEAMKGVKNDAFDKKIVSKNEQDKPYEQFDRQAQYIHRLIAAQGTVEGQTLCQQTLSELEQKFLSAQEKDFPSFIKREIATVNDAKKREAPELHATLKRSLDFYVENKKMRAFSSAMQEKDGKYFYVSKISGKEQTWEVGLYDQTVPMIWFRSTDPQKPGLAFSIAFMDEAQLNALDGDLKMIEEQEKKALQTYEKEHTKEHWDTLTNYDLPKDRPIIYLRVFSKEYDPVASPGIITSSITGSALRQRYGERVIVSPPLFTDDPAQEIRAAMHIYKQRFKDQPLHFITEVSSHGLKDRYLFHTPMTANDLYQLHNRPEFKNDSFTNGGIMCYGAGMVSGLENHPEFQKNTDLQKRWGVFTQTSSDRPGIVTRSTIASMYHAYFLEALQKGATYGEAAKIADLETQKVVPVNPEAIVNGKVLALGHPQPRRDARA